jgi:hypothetical protein
MHNKLILSGGLGNQIFQYVAACQIFENSEFQIDCSTLNPRANQEGESDLAQLKLNRNTKFVESDFTEIQKILILGLLHLSSVGPGNTIKRKCIRALKPLVLIVLERTFFKGINLVIADGIGGCEPNISKGANILIGNFHSYTWFDKNPRKYSHEIVSKENSASLEIFKNQAQSELPLVVHIRLGDFTQLEELNVVTPKFFIDSINDAWNSGKYRKIWVFSNDETRAVQFLPKNLLGHTRIIDTFDLSPAQILEVMKLGVGYVISNSTFGWWAATLSTELEPEIYVPSNWYKSVAEPKNLIRSCWTRVTTV